MSSQADGTIPLSKLPLNLRIDQVAGYFQISDDQVRGLVESGELLAIDISNAGGKRIHVRIQRQSVEEFERRRAVK